jgi:CubicO group peptidase (beta-lactamase class C family)
VNVAGRLTRREVLAGGAALLFGRPGRSAQGFIPAELAAMEQAARDFMDRFQAPGLSVAFAKDGRLVYKRAFGEAAADEPLSTEHRFRVASVSKPFTAATVMSLVEQGKVKLSDRVFGPDAALGVDFGGPPYQKYVADITVDHLLTHTAGGWQNDGSDPMFRNPRMNARELIEWTIANVPLANPPGERHAYSNFGFCILGRVIEKLTGKTYAEAVRDEILKRCGISSMEIAGNTLRDRKPREVVYTGQNGQNPYNMQVSRMDAHGGWLSTASDLVRFVARVDQFPTVPDILKPPTERQMVTPSNVPGGGARYARGWAVNWANYFHSGSLPGTSTIMVRTGAGFCWAGLTNTRTEGINQALDRLMWEMIGKITTWPIGEPT